MSYVNALWLAAALWVVAVVTVGAVFGISSLGVALLAFAGIGAVLVGNSLRHARGSTMSEDIQRQLR